MCDKHTEPVEHGTIKVWSTGAEDIFGLTKLKQ